MGIALFFVESPKYLKVLGCFAQRDLVRGFSREKVIPDFCLTLVGEHISMKPAPLNWSRVLSHEKGQMPAAASSLPLRGGQSRIVFHSIRDTSLK